MDSKLLRSLEWRCIGPHRGGRVVAVAGHPTDFGTFYFGGAAGGVWKTTNGGSYWENVSDGYFGTAAIGAIAVSSSDPNVLFVGTGETTIRGNVSHGDGVYKSSDGGRTWRNVGLHDTRHIGDILIHPTNPDIAWVAALGHAWGPNEERGVFKTTDGGKTWRKVLYKSSKAGAVDLAMDPHYPDVLYATIWQTQRHPHMLWSGGEDSGLWKSTDGGEAWTEITRNKGLPQDMTLGKLGVAASPAQAGRVWAIVEAGGKDGKGDVKDEGGVFRSEDWGETWEKLSTDGQLRRRPWYYQHIFADPQDADTVYVLNIQSWMSTDGGKTFFTYPTPHGDNHDLWIDPHNPQRRIQSDDGGAYVSFDGGRHWSTIFNQPTAQFYHVTTDTQVPYNVYGSQQDNWAMKLPSIDFEGAISWKDYVEPGGGESGYMAVSPRTGTVFGGGIGTGPGHGRLIAWNPQTGHKRNITVWPEVHGMGVPASQLKYRFQWTFPVEISPHNPDVLYICSNHVHRSTDEGTTWEVISPDLTRNEPTKLIGSGGPITADNTGAEIYCTIFAFRESPHEPGVLWAGTDDGLVQLSRDSGQTWKNVTPPELPEWAMISIIEPSPHDRATTYVAATRYKHDDLRPYLFKTSDYGETWTSITNGIPATEFTRVIREDPNRRGLLYAGTETGIYISWDDGRHWHPFTSNLPVAPIHDLIVKGTDLIVATHGRAFWILDDTTPLYQMSEATLAEPATLFKPRDTMRFRIEDYPPEPQPAGYAGYKGTGPVTVIYHAREAADGTRTAQLLEAGKNPPDGVIVHYAFAEKPEKAVTLRFLDAEGKELRSFTSEGEALPRVPVEPGANRFVWDMRTQPPTKLENGEEKKDPWSELMEAATAPRVLPGRYQVQLVIGDTTLTQPVTILPDPRLAISHDDLVAQYELKVAIRDRLSEVHETLNRVRRLRKQVEGWEERAKPVAGQNGRGPSAENKGNERLTEAATPLKEKLTLIEAQLINLDAQKPMQGCNQLKEKLTSLSAMIDESDHAPTQGARQVYVHLAQGVQEQMDGLQRLLDTDVRTFNDLVRTEALEPVGV